MLILVFEFSVDGGLLVMLVEGATWKLCGQEQNEPIFNNQQQKKPPTLNCMRGSYHCSITDKAVYIIVASFKSFH